MLAIRRKQIFEEARLFFARPSCEDDFIRISTNNGVSYFSISTEEDLVGLKLSIHVRYEFTIRARSLTPHRDTASLALPNSQR